MQMELVQGWCISDGFSGKLEL